MSMTSGKQTTLRERIEFKGAGVHSNAPVRMVLHPADAHSGIVFLRTNLPNGSDRLIEAKWSNVSLTELCTVLGDPNGASVSTVEHLLATFAAFGIDNVIVEVDGPEVPIMDGSAAAYVQAIDQVGLVTQSASRRYIKVLKPVRVEHGRGFSELRPHDEGFRLEVEIDFDSKLIGRQSRVVNLGADVFRKDISRARTFGFVSDVERLWKAGFALGSSLENTVALDGERILNPEGLRYRDEFVRHKMLDAIGDLALAGAPLLGCYRSYCGGHKMNVGVLQALFADRSNYSFVETPRRHATGVRSDAALAPVAAFAPDLS
jgi:UDP-3-O-[3-hydroxymyristoyl] N-acetylglucosamine deacetylase